MKDRIRNISALIMSISAILAAVSLANAEMLVPVTGITANHGGDQYGLGLISLIDGSGMDRTASQWDPSTWTCTENHYNQTWMGNFLVSLTDPNPVPTLNEKLAWVVFDLGGPTELVNMYLWNIRYQGGPAGTKDYNVYYTDSPAVALPSEPTKGKIAITGLTPEGDYDFASPSSGWTNLNTSGALTINKAGDSVVALGITARYISLEILSNHGDTYKGGRVGFSEVAFTEPDDPQLPTVDAGPDWITWSGASVTLNDVNVVDNSGAGLTYQWTADPDTGVEFSSANVESPTVTITKPQGDLIVVTLTLSTNYIGSESPAVSDSITIDVFDDQCKAALGIGQAAIDPGDFNEDCKTNLTDFVMIADRWLTSYEITEPEVLY